MLKEEQLPKMYFALISPSSVRRFVCEPLFFLNFQLLLKIQGIGKGVEGIDPFYRGTA